MPALRVHEVFVQPREDEGPHFRQLDVAAVKEFDAALFLAAVFAVEREKMLPHALDAGGRCQQVLSPIHAQTRTRHDQLVDLMRLEVLEETRNIVVDPVSPEVIDPDELLEVGKAADVDA